MTDLLMLGLLLTSMLVSPGFADTYSVRFRAIDSDGKPIVNADLSTRWITGQLADLQDEPKPGPQPVMNKAKTDEDGFAKLVFEDYSNHVVMGYTKDRKSGGLVIVERQDEGNTLEIDFSPTVDVTALYECSETDSIPKWSVMLVSVEEVPGYFFEFRNRDGRVHFPLPVGQWKCRIYGSGIKEVRREFETKPGELVEMGTIDFEPTAMAKLIGKPAPKIDILDARGVPMDFQLSDYKGKWVLIEFWGHW